MASDFEGKVIHRSRDKFGELIVADTGFSRSLYFGKTAVQSSMLLDFPEDLALHYARAMMSVLIFEPEPRQVLLIGLGGGSIAGFLLRACLASRICAIEIRSQVIEIAHRFFGLPENDPRLEVVCGDGRQYVFDQVGVSSKYDIILVDAYDETSRMDAVTDLKFMTAARNCLSDNGILAFNLWTGPSGNFYHCQERLSHVFAGHCRNLVLDPKKGNAILLAFKNPSIAGGIEGFRPAAQILCERFSINFPAFLDDIVMRGSC